MTKWFRSFSEFLQESALFSENPHQSTAPQCMTQYRQIPWCSIFLEVDITSNQKIILRTEKVSYCSLKCPPLEYPKYVKTSSTITHYLCNIQFTIILLTTSPKRLLANKTFTTKLTTKSISPFPDVWDGIVQINSVRTKTDFRSGYSLLHFVSTHVTSVCTFAQRISEFK